MPPEVSPSTSRSGNMRTGRSSDLVDMDFRNCLAAVRCSGEAGHSGVSKGSVVDILLARRLSLEETNIRDRLRDWRKRVNDTQLEQLVLSGEDNCVCLNDGRHTK